MKYCKFCGAELPENGVCSCEESKNADVNTAGEATAVKASGDKKNTIILGAAVLVVLIIVISLIGSMFSGGYKAPVDDFFKGLQKCNVKTIAKALPEDDAEDFTDELSNKDLKKIIKLLEEYYGDNLKISYKITDKEELKKTEINDLEDSTDLKISKAYDLELDVKFKGKDDSDEDSITLTVAKIKGEGWKIVGDASTTSRKSIFNSLL